MLPRRGRNVEEIDFVWNEQSGDILSLNTILECLDMLTLNLKWITTKRYIHVHVVY